jgi:hypothetical protein
MARNTKPKLPKLPKKTPLKLSKADAARKAAIKAGRLRRKNAKK